MLGLKENSASTFHIRWIEKVKFQGQLIVQRIRVKIALNVVKASKLVQMKLIT